MKRIPRNTNGPPDSVKTPIPPHPRRRLGQNFLIDSNIIEKIVQFVAPSSQDVFLEIGAGTGALTRPLAARAKQLHAIEVDASLIPYLQQIPNTHIIHGDIRKLDLCALAPVLRIAGNLPYYISTSVLSFLIAHKPCIQDITLMFQEEVARRIVAPPSNPEYSLLSVLVQYFCEIRKGFKISRNCFYPKPEVESRILHFRFNDRPSVDFEEYYSFLVKAFSQRRKKLRNNLLRTIDILPESLDVMLHTMGIDLAVRAENLSPGQFEQLILALKGPKA